MVGKAGLEDQLKIYRYSINKYDLWHPVFLQGVEFLAQWLEHRVSFHGVLGSNPIRDMELFANYASSFS